MFQNLLNPRNYASEWFWIPFYVVKEPSVGSNGVSIPVTRTRNELLATILIPQVKKSTAYWLLLMCQRPFLKTIFILANLFVIDQKSICSLFHLVESVNFVAFFENINYEIKQRIEIITELPNI